MIMGSLLAWVWLLHIISAILVFEDPCEMGRFCKFCFLGMILWRGAYMEFSVYCLVGGKHRLVRFTRGGIRMEYSDACWCVLQCYLKG